MENTVLDFMPFIKDPDSRSVPGLDETFAAVSPSPFISTLQEAWEGFKNDPVEFVQYGLSESSKTIKENLPDVPNLNPITALDERGKTIFWYAMIGVVIVGTVYYFSKSSAHVKLGSFEAGGRF